MHLPTLNANGETYLAEPQWWLYDTTSERTIEVCEEGDWYSVRLHCADAEEEHYRSTCGVLDTVCFDTLGEASAYIETHYPSYKLA